MIARCESSLLINYLLLFFFINAIIELLTKGVSLILLALVFLFIISQDSDDFPSKVSKLLEFKNTINIEYVKSEGIHNGSYYLNENKVVVTIINNKLSKEVLSHEITHFIVHNDENLKVYNHFFYRELLPDIVSLEFEEEKVGCEHAYSRKTYRHISFDNYLLFSQGNEIKRNTAKCCEMNDSEFCQHFSRRDNHLSYYPESLDFSLSHNIGIPVLNFFIEMKERESNFIQKFISHLREERDIFALSTFRSKIENKEDYDHFYKKYRLEKHVKIIDQLNSRSMSAKSSTRE